MFEKFRQLFSATEFARDEVTEYARRLILPETRFGLVALAVLLLGLQCGTYLLEYRSGRGDDYFYTFLMLSLLSCHMILSSFFVKETQTLHFLAITYLIVYGMSIALAAHRSGEFDIALMASAVMLIVAVPLVPWGLKEAAAVSILIYTLFTASTVAVSGRFNLETLWTLQFLFVASSIVALSLVAQNVRVRKHDIESRYDLEQEQKVHKHLSLTDPLTGAFNRRYLNRHYDDIVAGARARDQFVTLVLLDIDQFKPLNDTFGHHIGDEVLKRLVDNLVNNLPGNSTVIRLGGDEFAVLYVGDSAETDVSQCLKHLETDPAVLRSTRGKAVTVSMGSARVADCENARLETVYRTADVELYSQKRRRKMKSFDLHTGKLVTT